MLLMVTVIVYFFYSIEDPFETHYDVAHVIKSAQMAYFRKELLVSRAIFVLKLAAIYLLVQALYPWYVIICISLK